MWAGLHGAEGSMAGDDCAFACADARALACAGEEAGAVWGSEEVARQATPGQGHPGPQQGAQTLLAEAVVVHGRLLRSGPPTPPHGAAPRPGSRAPEALVVLLPLS
ncbi:unnamed protein product, partial [Prorocentrum cordatum]